MEKIKVDNEFVGRVVSHREERFTPSLIADKIRMLCLMIGAGLVLLMWFS